jgi:DNA repair exonuclease SbcCD ATPase subunit
MQTLTIHTLKIKNFKGIKSCSIEPEGESIQLSGANGTGKTTIQDAFAWLLFGKDSNDRADFQLKPVDPDGNEIHNLDTEVTATLDLSGDQITLKKRFSEKWVKKRGSAQSEFTGHQTDHFIDDVPVKKKEYDARVSEIADPGVFKLVTSPAEFNRLHWQDRRRILLDMCGDVADADVIAENKDLDALAGILGKRSIDDHMKTVKAQQRDINKELEQIPVRIDELTASLADVQPPDLKTKLTLEKDLAQAKEKLESVRNNERLSQKRIEANEIRAQIQDIKHQAKTGLDDESARIIQEINVLGSTKQKHLNRIEQLRHDIERDEKRNGVAMEAMERLRQQWFEVNKEVPETDDTCPACGQDLPADQVEAARGKANQIKAEKLAAIQQEGVDLKTAVEGRISEIKKAQDEIAGLEAAVKSIEKETSDLADQMPEGPTADTRELDKKLAGVQSEIEALEHGRGIQEKDIQLTIDDIERKLADIAAAEAGAKAAEKTRARIKELEQQEKKLAEEYEKLAEQVYLAERFIVEKVRLLEDKINSRFEMATFKLFNELINTGIEETCITTYNGVPWPSLNSAGRVQVGMDIISTISEYYGFSAPIWIDNREGVTWIPETDSQTISLIVDPKYNQINISEAKNREEVAA